MQDKNSVVGILVRSTREAGLELVQGYSLHNRLWEGIPSPESYWQEGMLVHIFAAVREDKLDVMAPGVDSGRGGILEEGKHGQVVVGFVNNAQTHIYPASLEGFPVKGLKHRSNTAVPTVNVIPTSFKLRFYGKPGIVVHLEFIVHSGYGMWQSSMVHVWDHIQN